MLPPGAGADPEASAVESTAAGAPPGTTPFPSPGAPPASSCVVAAVVLALPPRAESPHPPRMGASLRRIVVRMTRRLSGGRSVALSEHQKLQRQERSHWASSSRAFAWPKVARALRLLPPPAVALGRRLGALRLPRRRGTATDDGPRPRSCSDSRAARARSRSRGHGRSASDTAGVVLGAGAAGSLARVPEARETPCSSPPPSPFPSPTPSPRLTRRGPLSAPASGPNAPELLLLPRTVTGAECAASRPALRYVDGHLLSNTSSGVSSTSSDSSPSDVSDDPDAALTPPPVRRPSIRLFSAFTVTRRLPRSSESVNEVFASDVSGGASPAEPCDPPAAPSLAFPPPPLVMVQSPGEDPLCASTPPGGVPELRARVSSPVTRAASALVLLPTPSVSAPASGPSLDTAPSPAPDLAALHKSRSAANLQQSRPPHATNALKHGPCLLPPSRQAPTGGGDEPLSSERPPASPPTVVSAVVAAAAATAAKVSPSPAKLCSLPAICRRSSDSDLSITPKGNSLTGSDRSSTAGLQLRAPLATPRTALNQENLDMMEYPFLTMTKYPPGFIVHIGGMVNARSVKLLERISNLEEPESRDSWWTELRMEVRSHARALACNVVLGYEESTSICDDVCVLSAAGTAAVVASGPADPAPPQPPSSAAAAASAAIAAAQAQASTQQATPQQQPAPAASALASAGASPAQAPPSAPAQPQTPAAAAAGVSAAEAVATPGPSSSAVVVAAATVIASNADRFAATAAVAGTASFSSSLDREVPSPQQERERDRSTPQRTPALAAASSTAFVSVSQPLSMTGKVRHCSEGVGGAATEEAGGLGTFAGASTATGATSSHSQTQMQAQCWPCHLPYNENVVPFRVVASRCSVCRRHRVPELMYTSIEPPEGLAITGRGCLLHAYVCRPKRDMGRGELNAKEISDGLPFLEYELHRTLSYKLRLRGMNAVFGLRVQVAIGERLMVAMATGTACYLAALPPAPVPKVTAGNLLTEDSALVEVQRMIQDAVRRARESFGLPVAPRTAATAATGSATAASSTTSTAAAAASSTTTTAAATAASDTDESEEDLPDLELSSGNKDACVFEIDDTEDMEVVKHLLEPPPPDGFQACTTELPPGLDESELAPGPQMFTHVWRSRLPVAQGPASRTLHALCTRLLQGLFFKLRRAAPAALTRLRFRVELPDADEIQISVLGMALGVVEVERPPPRGRRKLIAQSCSRELLSTRRDESDLIFSLEEDQVAEAAPSGGTPPPSAPAASPAAPTTAPMPAVRPLARTFQSLRISSHGGAGAASAAAAALSRERFGVDISPLSYAPGGRIERYLGNLNFFFIRESTSIREAGGLSGFVHSFACEVLAIVRSHVTALGGNAMVAYFMSECVLYHNPHKNQGQCLINVGGDVVSVSYDE